MSVIYSGQTITNTTVSAATNATLIQAVEAALVNVGWTLIKDGTADGIWRVRSAATPQGMQGDVWMWNGTGGSTPPALFAAASAASTAQASTSGYQEQGACNLACSASATYQLIANPYYFYLINTTVPMPTQGSFFFSVPYVPSNLTGLVNSLFVAAGGSTVTLGSAGLTNSDATAYTFLNGAGLSGASNFKFYGVQSGSKPTWFDGSCEFYEPRVMGQQTNTTSGAVTGGFKALGYQWDALIINVPLPRNTTISYDGGTWQVISEASDPGLLVKIA